MSFFRLFREIIDRWCTWQAVATTEVQGLLPDDEQPYRIYLRAPIGFHNPPSINSGHAIQQVAKDICEDVLKVEAQAEQ